MLGLNSTLGCCYTGLAMVLFLLLNLLCSFVLAPLLSGPCFVGVCRSGASFDSQPRSQPFVRAPGSEMREPACRRARTRTRRPAPQTAKTAKAVKHGICTLESKRPFSVELSLGKERKEFPLYILGECPPPLRPEEVNLRLSAQMQVVSPTQGRLPLHSSEVSKEKDPIAATRF